MKKIKRSGLVGILLALSFTAVCFAENYDFPNMSLSELNEVKGLIDEQIKTNHTASSKEQSAVEDATKAFVEEKYGKDNVDWAWFDYTYTKDWNFYSLSTHADIKKADGGKAQYDVYSEVFAVNDNYQIVYVKIGEEEIFDQRSSVITDQRVLKQLGLEEQSTPKEAEESSSDADAKEQVETPTEKTADTTPIAQRGDKSEEALAVQEMLARLGYPVGTPDGSFGEKTESAVKKFQEENGFTVDGIVTQAVYDALKSAAAAAPEPEEIISISAVDLYNQFDNNAISAKSTYKGKTIQVTGTIGSIDESIWGTPYVRLNADEYGWSSVTCYFASDSVDSLAGLNTGQKVTIKGTCGEMGLADVDVKDCTLIG